MDSKNLPITRYHLAVTGPQNRVLLQISDSAEPGQRARLYIHSQIDSPAQMVADLSALLISLGEALRANPEWPVRVRMPEETGCLFRCIERSEYP